MYCDESFWKLWSLTRIKQAIFIGCINRASMRDNPITEPNIFMTNKQISMAGPLGWHMLECVRESVRSDKKRTQLEFCITFRGDNCQYLWKFKSLFPIRTSWRCFNITGHYSFPFLLEGPEVLDFVTGTRCIISDRINRLAQRFPPLYTTKCSITDADSIAHFRMYIIDFSH